MNAQEFYCEWGQKWDKMTLKIITGLSDTEQIHKLRPTFSEMGTLKKTLWNYVASGGKKASERD